MYFINKITAVWTVSNDHAPIVLANSIGNFASKVGENMNVYWNKNKQNQSNRGMSFI